jgi:hypothetical protein
MGTDRHPSISPDGKTVVFTGQVHYDELFTSTRQADGSWSAPKQVTFDRYGGVDYVDHTEPVFEPDGRTVAFRRSDMTSPSSPVNGTYTVDVTVSVPPKVSVNTPTNPETKISDDYGDVAVRTDAKTAGGDPAGPAARRPGGPPARSTCSADPRRSPTACCTAWPSWDTTRYGSAGRTATRRR